MLGLFGPKSDKIGAYRVAFVYQGPFREENQSDYAKCSVPKKL